MQINYEEYQSLLATGRTLTEEEFTYFSENYIDYVGE